MFNTRFRILLLASVMAFAAVQAKGNAPQETTFCCPTSEDSLDHPSQQKNFIKAEYRVEPEHAPYEEDGSDADSIPNETVLYCSYDDNVTCAFHTTGNGGLKTVYHSMCHTAAVKVEAGDVSSNSYCAKPL